MGLIYPLLFIVTVVVPLGDTASSTTPQKTVEVTEVPNPMTLSTNWWGYFNGSAESQKDKSARFLMMLETLQMELTAEEIEAASPFVTKILIQLDVYNSLKVEQYEPPVAYPFHDSYTVEQITLVAHELFTTKASLNQNKMELFRLTQQREKLESHLDHQSVAYFKMDKPSQEKLILGLDIIGTRIGVAIKDKLLKTVSSEIQFLSDKYALLTKELDYAIDHLNAETINPQEIQARINHLQSELVLRQNETLRAELKTISYYGNGEGQQIEGVILNQEAVDSLLDDAIITAEIDAMQLVLLLAKYNGELSSDEVDKLQTKIREIKRSLEDLKSQNEQWGEVTREGYAVQNEQAATANPDLDEKFERHRKVQQSSIEKIASLRNWIFIATLFANSLEARFQSQESTWSCCWYSAEDYWYMAQEKAYNLVNYKLFKVNELPITVGSIGWAVLAFSIILFLSSLFRAGLKRFSGRIASLHVSNLYVLDRLIFYTTIVVAVFIFFYALGFDTTNILLVIGGLSVGIGFGLQSIVNNFVCSLIILFHRKIKIGDLLEIATGEWGKVIDINVQNTVIHTWDGTDIVVPNSNLLSQKYENWTLDDYYKRLRIPFGVAYGSDKDVVTKAVLEAADKVSCTIKNHRTLADPSVWLVDFQDSALGFELVVWVNLGVHSSIGSYTAAYKWEIESALKEYGITIPFPQRDLHIKEMPSKV